MFDEFFPEGRFVGMLFHPSSSWLLMFLYHKLIGGASYLLKQFVAYRRQTKRDPAEEKATDAKGLTKLGRVNIK